MSKITEPCAFDGCSRPRYSRSYCTAHYRQSVNGRPLRPLRPYIRQAPQCLAEGCSDKPHAHGYCKLHLNRVERHGTTEATRDWNPGATCKAEENGERCPEPVSARGYCRMHYMRVQRTGGTERRRQQYAPDATCKVEENGKRCPDPVKSDGYCQTHYMRIRRTGEAGGPERIPQRKRQSKYAGETCKAELDGKRCSRTPKALGWCPMHYHRWQRTGDPLGKWGLEPRKSQGYITTDGYRMSPARRNKRPVLEHRLVMEQIIGRPLRRFEEPHHKNGIRDDNTPGNLELWVKWRRQPNGQRLTDLIDFVVTNYPGEIMTALTARMSKVTS
jgi:hypothetical protein